MQLLDTPQFQPGDMVRYLGTSRDAGLSILPGTLGSVVSVPMSRRVTPSAPEQIACQVLFGYRTSWVPVEKLAPEWR